MIILDWIADKLGYQRKFISVPIRWPPIPQELLDDGILQPSDMRELMEIAIWGPLFGARWISDESDIPFPLVMDWK